MTDEATATMHLTREQCVLIDRKLPYDGSGLAEMFQAMVAEDNPNWSKGKRIKLRLSEQHCRQIYNALPPCLLEETFHAVLNAIEAGRLVLTKAQGPQL